MEILSEEEMAMRVDFRSPLQKEDPDAIPPKQSVYSIPFEYGANPKGTVISVALARTIAAELRAEIAEWEKAEIFRAFKQEKVRADEAGKRSVELQRELFEAKSANALLEQKLRKTKKYLRSATYGKR